MKKFLFIVLLYFLIFTTLIIVFCGIIDPFNVMHTDRIRDNGIEPNKNYIKMTYILNNPQKFDSFIFGSSRVGNIHVENIAGERCYNMTYSMGLPKEHLDNIKTFLSVGIKPKRIYIGVDSLSYTNDPADHFTSRLWCPYEHLKKDKVTFFKLYFDPAIVGESLSKVIQGHVPTEQFVERFYKFGWDSDYNTESVFKLENATPNIFPGYRMRETLQEISEIVNVCKANNIDLVIFTNPLCSVTYEASIEQDYLLFLKELANITPYYNFSGYNAITTNDKYYLDSSHYTAEASDFLIECMCNGKQYNDLYEDGFGVYVTEENVDELIRTLQDQLD